MDKRRIRVVLFGVMLLLGAVVAASAGADPGQAEAGSAAPLAVRLRAASGASIGFKTQNGKVVDGVSPETLNLPYLVLHRNGALTEPAERTLVVQMTGIEVPPGGVTVTLNLETAHGDPDLASGPPQRIPVWQGSRRIANTTAITETGVSLVWEQEFGEKLSLGARTVDMPTDYFRWELVVTDAMHPPSHPLHTFSQDYAFLMENQWIAPLPRVAEASAGAAPDELIVYYCDMSPFRLALDPSTWLRREQITEYVHSQLVPAMEEAYRVQTDEWGFPWYEEWTSYRTGQDTDRLSVALTEGQTWFHGQAPGVGHAAISLNVDRSSPEYNTLTEALIGTFHHELFHNLQRDILQHYGGYAGVDRPSPTWDLITEGTAVLASSVGQSDLQFNRTWGLHAYVANAGRFVGSEEASLGDLNRSYEKMIAYHAAAYWRFLYEHCGGMANGVENPAAGFEVIRRVLVALSGEDAAYANGSADLVERMLGIMDKALDGSSCPFQTYEESLQSFAQAIYELRLESGRCVAPGVPMGCGFYDPKGLYPNPPAHTITYTGTMTVYAEADQPHPAGIPSSFGIDLVDVALDPSLDGQPLAIDFYGAAGAQSEFTVQVWYLMDLKDGGQPRPVATQALPPAVPTEANPNGQQSLVISRLETAKYDRLGLVISRIDANERSDPSGSYSVRLYTPQ